jgi:dephospho-CoA kinase
MEEEIYKSLVKGVRKPKKHKKALFICGSSGTGKTASKGKFVEDAGIKTTYVYLNIDKVWDMMGKKGDVSPTYNKIIEKVISAGYSFMYDGTCRNFQNVHLLMEYSKNKGYNIKLGMVYANLKTTLERLKKRKEQPLKEHIARDIYTELSRIANQYMNLDEIYLYNNDHELTLIYSKTTKKVNCIHPEMKFYFDVSEYC